jgi:ABC-2 type transport system permease protein
MGLAVMGFALHERTEAVLTPGRVTAFILLFACGTAMTYGFLVLLTSTAVWFKRNQSLYEMWWLFSSLMRYPREIFEGPWAGVLGKFFTYVIPILLVVNVPARIMVKFLDDPAMIGFTVTTAAVLLVASRKFFRQALRRYRSASS